MRVFFMGNNRVALEVAMWLKDQGAEIVGAAVHPRKKARYRDEIVEALHLPSEAVFLGSTLRRPQILARIAELAPELGLSILFDYILRAPCLALFAHGVVNLHPSLLPHNRGQYPNVWSIVERTPAGATLHYLDEGIDTGDIIAQTPVVVSAADTGETLYRRLEQAALALFKRHWAAIETGKAPRSPQASLEGSFHRTADVDAIDRIDLDRSYRAGDLIDILRARTFPPYRGAYFLDGDTKVYLQLGLSVEQETRPADGDDHDEEE